MSGISKKNVSNIKRVFDSSKRSGSSVSSKNKIHIAQNRMLQSKLQQNLLLNGQIHDISRRFFNTLFSVADRIRQKLSVGLMLRASPRTTREEKKKQWRHKRSDHHHQLHCADILRVLHPLPTGHGYPWCNDQDRSKMCYKQASINTQR